jgi:acyl dehydratase
MATEHSVSHGSRSGAATFRCNTLKQRDEVVQTFTGTLLVWRRDGGIHLTG